MEFSVEKCRAHGLTVRVRDTRGRIFGQHGLSRNDYEAALRAFNILRGGGGKFLEPTPLWGEIEYGKAS